MVPGSRDFLLGQTVQTSEDGKCGIRMARRFQRAISASAGSACFRSSARIAGSRFSVSADNAIEDLLRSVHSIEFSSSMKGCAGISMCNSGCCCAYPPMTPSARIALFRTWPSGSFIASTRSCTIVCFSGVWAIIWAASARCAESEELWRTSRSWRRCCPVIVTKCSCADRAAG